MAYSRKPLMAGNWKMYKTGAEALAYVAELSQKLAGLSTSDLPDVVVCMPFTALARVAADVPTDKLALGAQNVSQFEEGAYTGEISAAMLVDAGVRYVVVGHSERREYYGETDETVNAKTKTLLKHHLTPIVCVGESLTQRDAGETDALIATQVQAALQGLSAEDIARLVFAYEPVWAIGTGKVCDPAEANRVIGLIRGVLGNNSVRILYGGSMKPDNAVGLMAQSEIDGGLVGGASLDPANFMQLINAAMPAKVG